MKITNMLDITMYSSLSDFFEKNPLADQTGYYFSTKAQHTHTEVIYPDNCYLFFGKESAGLPESLLFGHPDSCVRIPMLEGARSLNLSNSVAIGVFEVLRQWGFPMLQCSGELRQFDWAAAKSAHPDSEYL